MRAPSHFFVSWIALISLLLLFTRSSTVVAHKVAAVPHDDDDNATTTAATVAGRRPSPSSLPPPPSSLFGQFEGEELTAANSSSSSSNSLGDHVTWEGGVTAASCVALLIVLVLDLAPCAAAMFGVTLFLRLCGIITQKDALYGLSNSSVITVQLLVIMIAPVSRLPIARKMIQFVLAPGGPSQSRMGASSARSMMFASARITLLAYALSWFVGNIPVTAMFTPIVHQFCLDHDLPSSQLLMSLNIGSLIGGSFSKIGVSTTLLIGGMMEENGIGDFSFFETIQVSGPAAVVALLYLSIMPRFLLPKQSNGLVQHVKEHAASFLAQFALLSSSPLCGKRIEEVEQELEAQQMAILQVLSTDGVVHAPPDPLYKLVSGDIVGFTGSVAQMKEVAREFHLSWQPVLDFGFSATMTPAGMNEGEEASSPLGERATVRLSLRQRSTMRKSRAAGALGSFSNLSFAVGDTSEAMLSQGDAEPCFVEVVLSYTSPVVGLPTTSIRSRYRAALLGMRRGGKNLTPMECNRLLLQVGDTLLLMGPLSIVRRFPDDFLVTTVLDEDSGEGAQSQEEIPKFLIVPNWFPFGSYILSTGATLGMKYGSNSSSSGARMSASSFAGAGSSSRGGGGTASSSQQPPERLNNSSPILSDEDGTSKSHATESTGLMQASPATQSPMASPRAVALAQQHHVDPKTLIKVIHVPWWYAYMSAVVFATTIAVSIAGYPLEICCSCGVVAVLLLRIRRFEDACHSLKLEVYIVMAFSFGIGAAMSRSGFSTFLGRQMGNAGLTGWPLLFLIALSGTVLSNIISSKAAVQVLFPVVVQAAEEEHVSVRACVSVLAVSVITSFVTTYAHASNLIVMGPGGYSGKDFVRFGGPLNLIMAICTATAAYVVYGEN